MILSEPAPSAAWTREGSGRRKTKLRSSARTAKIGSVDVDEVCVAHEVFDRPLCSVEDAHSVVEPAPGELVEIDVDDRPVRTVEDARNIAWAARGGTVVDLDELAAGIDAVGVELE